MAKKRKAPGRSKDGTAGPNVDVGASRKRIKTFEDVAGSDDEFHLNRDRILLDEEPEAKRRRKWAEQEEFLEASDEEVLAYEDEDEEDEDGVEAGQTLDYDDDSEQDAREGEEVDEEEGIGWGLNKDEIYGADEIETEEQALEEEKEALRLQKKQLQSLSAADYGFDEDDWRDGADEDDEKTAKVVTEVLPQLQIRDDMGPAERLKLLKSRYPEFEPLSQDLLRVQEEHGTLLEELRRRQDISAQDDAPHLTIKLRSASAYAGALLMYFALLSSPAVRDGSAAVAMSATQLRDHPVMDALVKCKNLRQRTKKLPSDPEPSRPLAPIGTNGLNGDDVDMLESEPQQHKAEHSIPKKSRAQRHAEAVQQAADAKRADRMRKVEDDLANLDALIKPSQRSQFNRNKAVVKSTNGDDSSAGEEATPTACEAADKAKRKKSLRFYASQITQKANKRGAAGRNGAGDDDIPYRERLRDRQARLNAEAEKRGQRTAPAGAELNDNSDDDEDDLRQAREVRDAGGEDYYGLIASRTARRKAEKSALAAAQKQAAVEGGRVVPEETVGADGKRKITYAIEKNKGLAPRRKKEVRNPRVKKRKKFEEKKKKLGSVKRVYKGGVGRGGYGGELTGIKTGLVKSVKL